MATRDQLLADVQAAQKVLSAAEDALHEYDVSEFSKATGLNIGDELLITEDLRKMLRARMWAEFIVEQWSVGKEIKILDIHPSTSEFAVGSGVMTGDTAGIPINMVRQMRAAWLAQREVST